MGAQSASMSGGDWSSLLDSASKFVQSLDIAYANSDKDGNEKKGGYVGPALMGSNSSGAEANNAIATTYSQRANMESQVATSVANAMVPGLGTAVGMIAQPFLAYRQAKYEKKLYGMRAELAEMTASQYQTAAEGIIKASHTQVAAITHQAGQVKASTRVSQAASGVRVSGTGSAAEVLTSQDIAKEMSVNQTLMNGITQSFGYQRKKVESQIDAIGLRAAQDAVSPWTAALATITNPQNLMKGFTGMFGGTGGASAAGGSGGLTNLGFAQSPGN